MIPEIINQHNVREYETDPDGDLRIATMMQLLQDLATQHVDAWNVGSDDLNEKNQTWVASRYAVKIHRYPKKYEDLILRTWAIPRTGMQALRDFTFKTRDGETLISATSSWSIIDLNSHRPVRLNDAVPPWPTLEERAIDIKLRGLPLVEEYQIEKEYFPRRDDIDRNLHVTNSIYPLWALDAIPGNLEEEYKPAEIFMAYTGEARYGNSVVARTGVLNEENGKAATLHSLFSGRDDIDFFRQKTLWTKH